ncbi:plasma membrane channel protein [Ophiostoma piceae UAMH 11346]|uniref:Plasma membrane channel protein n=1 Tax=Ophiostoma piceae (strain UAMH 11346) TaxID=1262450 RepID=S3C8V7_OPHP1|nr:plasma membrane channel protein [Ophiostoma piceae UAMH 11346]
MATSDATSGNKLDSNSNYKVDYVIHYLIPPKERDQAEAAFVQLVDSLANAGFATEVRPGSDRASLLVFVKIASEQLLRAQVYRNRLQDYLYGIRTTAPPSRNNQGGVEVDFDDYFFQEPISEAERLRLAYLLITKPKSEGGAGISTKGGDAAPVSNKSTGTVVSSSEAHRKYVASIFPLHDHKFNRAWLKRWSTKYMLDAEDLDAIRDKFGEKIAFYFAFLQNYFSFLLFPAAFGFGAWLLIGQFSWLYAVVNCLWSVVFFEYWKKKEVDLAVQWGVHGVSKIQLPRSQFQFEREAQDPITGETVKVYSPFRRLAYQLLQVPFALACVVALGSLIGLCFSIEIFITELYGGPFKQYLTFLPTILLTVFMPILTGLLTTVAEKLTVSENYETQDDHQAAFVQKIFVINCITSYLPIFLTAFVYVPFGKVLVPYLDVFQMTAQHLTGDVKADHAVHKAAFQVNTRRLTQQVIYFTVTAQIVNFLTEAIVPYVKRKVFKAVKDVSEDRSKKEQVKDLPEEAAFLERVRNEAALDVYDVTIDYREMVVQFGYLSLFSVVWPLTACSFLVNNWVEARSDAMKITINSQRPIPWRGDSIGPWLGSLGFLSWLGSITSASIVFLFRSHTFGPDHSPWDIQAWALLLSIIFAEHTYHGIQLVVRYIIGKMDSPGLQRERAERFALRKRVLAESLGEAEAEKAIGPNVTGGEKITRAVLEEQARELSTKGHGTAEDVFWLRQRGPSESVQFIEVETKAAQAKGN